MIKRRKVYPMAPDAERSKQTKPDPAQGIPEVNYRSCRSFFRFMSDIGGCCALQSKAEAAEATRIVQWLGLPSHHDSQKNWDTLKALHYILALNEPGAPVLDAGSSGDSAILKWLNLLGFGKLYACDIRPKPSAKYSSRQIEFSVQDLTRTNYPDVFFKVVTCISVIEHGVDLNRFMAEMARVLKPGGVLLISTDYWSEPIDCHGIYPYGEAMGEMKVFQPEDIRGLVRLAERQGLDLCAPLRLETGERAVRWERVDRDYTFAFLPFRKA